MKFKKPSRKGLIVIVALMTCSTLGSHHSTIHHAAEPTAVAGIFGNLKDHNDSVFADIRVAGGSTNTTTNVSRSTFSLAASQTTRAVFASAKRPVMKVSGTLTYNQVWTTAYSYEITSHVTVPSGVSLTIGPGVIIKNDAGNDSGIVVAPGGTLAINGANTAPVVFTSTSDANAGDLTAKNPLLIPDYQTAVTTRAGASLVATDVIVSYASTAFSLAGTATMNGVLVNHAILGMDITDGSTDALATDIENTAQGISVTGGVAAVRGTIHAAQGINACDVGTDNCAVDAAYVDWGTLADPAATGMVCGNVLASPWFAQGSAASSATLSSENCTSAQTPLGQLTGAEQAFGATLAQQEINCTPDQQDANGICNQANTTLQCVATALQAIAPNVPYSLKTNLSIVDPTISADVSMMIAAYLNSQAERTPLTVPTAALTTFGQASSELLVIAQNYATCAA